MPPRNLSSWAVREKHDTLARLISISRSIYLSLTWAHSGEVAVAKYLTQWHTTYHTIKTVYPKIPKKAFRPSERRNTCAFHGAMSLASNTNPPRHNYPSLSPSSTSRSSKFKLNNHATTTVQTTIYLG